MVDRFKQLEVTAKSSLESNMAAQIGQVKGYLDAKLGILEEEQIKKRLGTLEEQRVHFRFISRLL